MFNLYGHHYGKGENDKIGHERFYQRPVVGNSKKYRKRLYNHRKARSVSQIDAAVLATANAASSGGGGRTNCQEPIRKRAPLFRHTSTSLDDLSHLHLGRKRPRLVNEEDESEEADELRHLFTDLNQELHRSSPAATTLATGATATPPATDSPLSNSLESLAKFFSGVFISNRFSSTKKSGTLPSIRRQYARYDYTALEDEQSNQEKMEMDKKQHRGTARGNALLTCQYYLRTSGRYAYLDQLNDIGSRIDKYWFMVRDSTLKTDRLMTMVPHNEYSPIAVNGSTKKVLSELFLSLQHPYIYPILDVDFKTMAEETFVIIIFPFNCHGSLKDLIYRSNSRDDWQEKYGHRNVGLPEPQIQRIGRQILEALLFLQDKGFPPFGHLHSGNVILQNGVARLTGLENTMLGYTSRIYPMLRKKLRDCRDAIDTICFGHVLFEMAAAYELNVAHPTEKHLQDIQSYSQVLEVLNFIFDRDDNKYPTIEELSLLDFFRNLDLREMRGATSPPVFQSKLSQSVKNLLKEVRRHQRCQKTSKRSHSTSSLETPSRESRSFPGRDLLDCATGIHRNLSASYTASGNCLVVLENGDVRHHLSATSVSNRLQATESNKSTPYSSLLDVSGHLMPSISSGASEEYHTPPTTPTVHSQLDLSGGAELDHHHQFDASTRDIHKNCSPPNLLQQCFQKIHNTFEGAVHKVSSRDSII